MFASTEFVALCQNQIALLTQGLGAALSVVYLADDISSSSTPNLVPIAAYPDTAFTDQTTTQARLSFAPSEDDGAVPSHEVSASTHAPRQRVESLQRERPLKSSTADEATGDRAPSLRVNVVSDDGISESQENAVRLTDEAVASSKNLECVLEPGATPPIAGSLLSISIPNAQQVIMPLVHEGVMLGVLLTARSDRPWVELEQEQIEQVAQTLAFACVLDQRAYWSQHNARQLEQLQAQQHELFDNLLHQFRNPLTALQTFGKLLLRRLPLQGQHSRERQFAESIVRESEHLQALIQQFKRVVELDTSNLLPSSAEVLEAQPDFVTEPSSVDESDRIPLLPSSNALTTEALKIQTCQLVEVLEPLVEWAKAIAQDRQVHLQVLLSPNMPAIAADPDALREALNNLIDNALKYTPAGGRVEVLSGLQRESNNRLMQGIAIIDNGPGIPAQDQTHLFERRFRGVQADSDIPGTGLGLAITHDLIQRMQGEIMVFSPAGESGLIPDAEASQQGTAFLVWLPEANTAIA